MIGIYKITNLINGKCYIGQSRNIEHRFEEHKILKKHNSHLKRAIKKYKLENFLFEIIKECAIEELNNLESYYILYFKSYDSHYGYNKTYGGGQNFKMTLESIEKMKKNVKISLANSEKAKAYHKRQIGQKRTEKTKQLQSISATQSWINGRNISNYNGGFTDQNREEKRKKCKLASLGKIHINNGQKAIQIYPEQLEEYLLKGWIQGRLQFSNKSKNNMSISAKERCKKFKPITIKNKKIMNKNGIKKYFLLEEVNFKLQEGWKLGRF